MFTPSIYGNQNNQELSFALRNIHTEELFTAREKSGYEADGILGSVNNPLLLSFAMDEPEKGLAVMPNPFRNELLLLNIPEGVRLVSIYDVQGKLIKSWSDFKSNTLIWDGNTMEGIPVSNGAYLLHFTGSIVHPSMTIIKQGNQ